MKELILEENVSIPRVEYDDETNILSIYGRAYPETYQTFTEPVVNWIKNNINKIIRRISVTLEYIDTSSSKGLVYILKETCCKDIDWYVEEGDDDMEGFAEMLRDTLKLNITISTIKEINSITWSETQKRDKQKYLEFMKKISNK